MTTSKMTIEKGRIKKIVNEFTSQTFEAENPEGLFLTYLPFFILLYIKQIDNSISFGNEG